MDLNWSCQNFPLLWLVIFAIFSVYLITIQFNWNSGKISEIVPVLIVTAQPQLVFIFTLIWMNWTNAHHCQTFLCTLHCYSTAVVPIHVTSSYDYPSFNHEQIFSHISHKWWLNTVMIRICNSPNDMQIHSGCLTVLMITKLNFLEAVR